MARAKEFQIDEVLDKAVNLFWNKGYNGISAEELVQGLGLSRSSLYDTFGDKHSLFTQALKRYREKITGDVIAHLDHAENIPEAIKEIFIWSQNSALQATGPKGCFMVNSRIELAPHDSGISDVVQENWQALEDAYQRAIKRGQEKGQIAKSHNPRALARFVLTNSWGLSAYGRGTADKKVFDDIIKIILSTLKND